MKRYDCLRSIQPRLRDELVVTNLGAVRHEWQYLRPHAGNYHLQNLGLTSSMALGLALALPHRKVIAFDGDGSLLLNLGSLATIANQRPRNLVHNRVRQRMLRVFAGRTDRNRRASRSRRGGARLRIAARHHRNDSVGVRRGLRASVGRERAVFHPGKGRARRGGCSGGGSGLPGKQISVRPLHRKKREPENPHLDVIPRH